MGWELPGRARPESECWRRSWRCYSWRLSAHCTPSGGSSLGAVSSPWLKQPTQHTVQTRFFIYIQEKIFCGSGELLPLRENLLVGWTLALITEVGLRSEAGTQYLLSPLFSLNLFHPYPSSWQFLSSSVTYTFFLRVLVPCSHILLGIDCVPLSIYNPKVRRYPSGPTKSHNYSYLPVLCNCSSPSSFWSESITPAKMLATLLRLSKNTTNPKCSNGSHGYSSVRPLLCLSKTVTILWGPGLLTL